MKKILKIKMGDSIPDGAKFLHAKEEIDSSKTWYYDSCEPSWIPFMDVVSRTRYTYKQMYHYYEVEE